MGPQMRAEDERRGVSDDFIRPRYLVWENVPGAFSSANGEDFRAVIEEIVHIKDSTCHVPRPDTGRWESAGAAILGDQFSLAWRVLDAQYWGVAQRRRRIFLVADFGGLTAPKILFEQERLPGDPAEGQDQGKGVTAAAGNSSADSGGSRVVLASAVDGKVSLMATATDGAQKKGAHAGNLIKAIAGLVGGGGGGRPGMAQAGGKNADGIDAAIAKVAEVAAEQMK